MGSGKGGLPKIVSEMVVSLSHGPGGSCWYALRVGIAANAMTVYLQQQSLSFLTRDPQIQPLKNGEFSPNHLFYLFCKAADMMNLGKGCRLV